MLARTSRLRHTTTGEVVDTPLLVPSFSSKGFGLRNSRQDGVFVEVSEAAEIFQAASEYLAESMLVSAYDIHHQYVPMPTKAITDIVIVDSGGYETSDLHDLSSTFIHQIARKEWDIDKYRAVLDAWPSHVPALFVSYDQADQPLPLATQIDNAKELFNDYRGQLSAFLIKPETKDQHYVQIPNIVGNIDKLQHFDVVGLTEKELGRSYLERMMNIAKVRLALDDANIAAPIHIFGSLDPISVPIYFIAGAEIFDGLTWLRYGYHGGMAVYRHNYSAKHIDLSRRDDFVKLKTMQDNLGALIELSNQMRKFLIDSDYTRFGANADIVREAADLLKTKIRRVA